MNKKIKVFLIIAAVSIAIVFLYRLLFIRTVNYVIAGVKIPSTYSILTGKVKAIPDYKGRTDLPTLEPHATKSIGLSDDQVAMAQFRWALFAQWAGAHPEYKGWDKDPEIFTKAREAFKKDMKKMKGAVVVQ